MGPSPNTRPSLLARIRDPRDRVAWAEFVDLYGPLVYDYGRRHGLQDADAADLMQEVLRAVAAAAGRFSYDPARGTFRSWLFTVTRRKLLDAVTRQRPGDRGTGDTDTQRTLEQARRREDSTFEDEWELAYRQRLLDWASERVRGEFRPATWQAFWLCAVEGRSPREASATLGLSVGSVYVAKCRVLARLREEIERVRRDGPSDELGSLGRD
ncbi:MAG: RNA polymerase sigma factor [Isosphaeraceae bacterium]